MPKAWKLAHVVPVYKKKSKAKVDNYRPVSLLSVTSKVMESIINQQVVNFLEREGIFSESQFGFRTKRGTSDLLTALNAEWAATLASGGCVRLLAADIAGAFDKVSHLGVLHKAEACGISGPLLAWLRSYLSDRTLRAILSGFASDAFGVAAGVPQGSVLGPTLFLLYVNDLEDHLPPGVKLAVYADDTTLYLLLHSPSSATTDSATLQAALDAYSRWCAEWRITLEPTKSHAMTLSRNASAWSLPPLVLDGRVVPEVEEMRLLGVLIDRSLTYGPHLDAVAARGRQRLGFLRKVRWLLSPAALATVYKAFVRPVLEYASLCWMGAAETHLRKLDAVQDAALEMLGPAAAALPNLDTLAHRRTVGALAYLFKLQSWTPPARLAALVPPPLPRPHGRTRASQLELAQWHSAKLASTLPVRAPAYLSRSFPHCVVDAWNDLPARLFAPGFGLDKVQDFKVAANAVLRDAAHAAAAAAAPAVEVDAAPAAPRPRGRPRRAE